MPISNLSKISLDSSIFFFLVLILIWNEKREKKSHSLKCLPVHEQKNKGTKIQDTGFC